MRHLILAFFALLPCLSSEAACRVHVPKREFDHSGYVLRFDFARLLEAKGFVEVERPEDADAVLSVRGEEFAGRFFHHAVASIRLGDFSAVGDRRCLTEFCSIGDFAKAFKKAYRELLKRAPVCRAG